MLPGIVAIDVPQETPIEWVDAATQACTAALGAGRCVRESDAVAAVWRARVSVDDVSPPVLRVELEATGDATEPSTRVLHFRDIDPERQRWASAGVVVAALVSAREAGALPETIGVGEETPPEPRPPDPAPTPVKPPLPTPVPVPRSEPSRLWLDIGFAPRSGAEGGPWALGGRFVAAFRPLDAPWLVSLNGSGAWVTTPFQGRWLSLGVGTGVRLAEVPAWDVGARFGVEEVKAGTSRVREGLVEREQGAELRLGYAVESRLAAPLFGPLGAFLGADASWHSAEIEVNSEERLLGRVPPFSFGMELGLRWAFLP